MSYLTVAKVDATRPDVARDLSDRNRMHKRLMSLYPDGLGDSPRQAINLLFAVDAEKSTITFQADMRPVVGPLNDARNQYFTSVKTNELTYDYQAGQSIQYEFNLAGLIRSTETGKRTCIEDEAVAIAKAQKLLADAGLDVSSISCSKREGVKSRARRVSYENFRMTGEASVSDPNKLQKAAQEGLGGGRLWGSALLVITTV